MKKKFLLISSYPDSLINFRGHLIKALISEGLEVHVVAPDLITNISVTKQLKLLGVHMHEVELKRTGMNPFYDLRTVFKLWRLMLKIKPDYSLGYTHKPVIYGNLAAWMARIPKRFALITGVGYTFQSKIFLLNYIVKTLYRIALGNTHKVLFQNPDDESLFFTLGILSPLDNKTAVINGSGVDLEKFKLAPFPNSIQFLLIARLLGDKGVREYFQAASEVRKKYQDISFGLVGWIDDNPNAISQTELQYWIDRGDVKFYGRLDDVSSAITDCSIYVLPSYSEGTPRTVLEAMAMGRPIITTDAPGCRETVVDGKNGFLVPVKEVDELVAAMLKFLDEPSLIEQMGAQSRKIAEKKYDVNKVNQQMLREMELK